jgi:small basic protein
MSSSPNRLGPSAKNPNGRKPRGKNPSGKTQTVEDGGDGNGNGVIDKMIGIAALVAGIVLGLVFHPSVPEVIQPYLPIAVVAALDAVFGGLRAYLERIFDPKVFVVSFIFNVLVAALIVYVGDQLGVGTQLSTAIIVVLGIRIFGNAAGLRRRLFGA